MSDCSDRSDTSNSSTQQPQTPSLASDPLAPSPATEPGLNMPGDRCRRESSGRGRRAAEQSGASTHGAIPMRGPAKPDPLESDWRPETQVVAEEWRRVFFPFLSISGVLSKLEQYYAEWAQLSDALLAQIAEADRDDGDTIRKLQADTSLYLMDTARLRHCCNSFRRRLMNYCYHSLVFSSVAGDMLADLSDRLEEFSELLAALDRSCHDIDDAAADVTRAGIWAVSLREIEKLIAPADSSTSASPLDASALEVRREKLAHSRSLMRKRHAAVIHAARALLSSLLNFLYHSSRSNADGHTGGCMTEMRLLEHDHGVGSAIKEDDTTDSSPAAARTHNTPRLREPVTTFIVIGDADSTADVVPAGKLPHADSPPSSPETGPEAQAPDSPPLTRLVGRFVSGLRTLAAVYLEVSCTTLAVLLGMLNAMRDRVAAQSIRQHNSSSGQQSPAQKRLGPRSDSEQRLGL